MVIELPEFVINSLQAILDRKQQICRDLRKSWKCQQDDIDNILDNLNSAEAECEALLKFLEDIRENNK